MLGLRCIGLVLFAMAGASCADSGSASKVPDRMAGVAVAERAAASTEQPIAREQPAALAGGQAVSWDELRPMLAEAAGGQVLQEAVLDRLLPMELKAKGLAITEADVAAERQLLADSIVHEARATPGDAERLLNLVRRSKGLGDVRFRRLLERNARMRKLVAPNVEVSEAEVAQAFEMLHGVKYRVRVIVTPGQTAVTAAREELLRAPEHLSVRFAEAAMKLSADPSAARGGLLEPISPADSAYPSSVREAVKTLEPGQISPVLAVDRGFTIVLLEERLPPDSAKLQDEAAAIAAEVRTRRERQAMDALGLRLIRSADLKVMDRSLDWSVNAARAGKQP